MSELTMPKILVVIGARPQFIKHFAFEKAAEKKLDVVTVHTGQHYDENMSNVFFNQLGMKEADHMLHIGSGKHGEQTARMMIELEKICELENPSALMVYGDTNSTLAGAIVASKIHIPVLHVEAGLRSFNKRMPEEVNRIMTDHISELLFVPSSASIENLKREGIEKGVYNVGDIMKDLIHYIEENSLSKVPNEDGPYFYVTLHRPYNVDEQDRLHSILSKLDSLEHKVIFAAHPRTLSKLGIKKEESAVIPKYKNIKIIPPQGYLENMGYLLNSEALITDSGGMQKEAYWLKKKCITIRSETEWTETLAGRANTLVFENLDDISNALQNSNIQWADALYGDGNASHKMVELILNHISKG